MNSDNIRLAWALVAGRLTHISEFQGLPRGQRPTAVCEACGIELVMKLGNIRAHHYAHRPRSHCPLTNPETARHYNTKQHLASKLRETDSLSVVIKCAFAARRTPCLTDLTYVAAEGWDDVRVETYIDPVRPDIVLLTKSAPILAIEVRATHAVSEEKAASLSKLGIPWIEVIAGAPSDEWKPESALRAKRLSKDAHKFCSIHSDIVNANTQAGGAIVPPQSIAKTNTGVTPSFQMDERGYGDRWRFYVVDCYPAVGPRVRRVFWAYSSRRTPLLRQLRLVDEGTSQVIAAIRYDGNPEMALKELHKRLRKYLCRKYEQFHSDFSWQDGSAYPEVPVTVYRSDFMSEKYRRDASREWVEVLRRSDD